MISSFNATLFSVPLQSEYVSEADKRRAFITGFTGSAGTAVILAEPFTPTPQCDAHHGSPSVCGRLFTDGRYFLQAGQELNPQDFELMKVGMAETPRMEDWLLHVLPEGSNVAIDPTVTSIASYKALKSTFGDRLNVVFTPTNLIDQVWTSSRPAYSDKPLMVLGDKFTGESSASKVERIRAKMASSNVGLLVVAALDEVAWLFNLRGSDIPFNPVFLSYALITPETITLYVDPSKVTDEVRQHLGSSVTIKPYTSIWPELKGHAAGSGFGPTKKVWMDTIRCNTAIYSIFPAEAVLEQENPIQLMKAIKNEVSAQSGRGRVRERNF